MKRTLIDQFVRATLLVPMCLIVFSFVSCSDDDDSSSVSTADDGYEVSGKISGHYYVDLGLSVKWADRNIGALSSSDYGDYFAWGETETKDEYTKSNSVTYGVEDMDDIAGNAEYDAATANWGNKWRMPTEDEIEELSDKCSWVWTSRNGYNGYLVTGPNANSIFLSAAGYRGETWLAHGGSRGYYMSSTPYDDTYAFHLDFDSRSHNVYAGLDDGIYRYYGRSVRPVSE